MRTVGILILSSMPLVIGIDIFVSIKKRRDFLFTFLKFIMYVKNEIRFACRERDEIIMLALRDPEFTSVIFEDIFKSLKYGKKLENIFIYNNNIRLNLRETKAVCSFIYGIGKSDVSGQLAHCDFYAEQLGALAKEADDKGKTKCKLALGLSISLSVALFIIMI